MQRIDKIMLGILFGSSFPILAVLIWFSYSKDENIVLYFVSAGLLFGLFIDILILKKLINNGFNLSVWFLICIYLFYNVCIFGFFMGFPVFNLIMGLIAGLYFGKKIIYNNIPMIERSQIIKRVAAFTGIIMFMICFASGLIAFIDQYTGKDLQGMLGLQFEVSKAMIMAIILIGGTTLIIAQYFLTKTVMIKTIKYYESNAS